MNHYETLKAQFMSAAPPRSLFPLLWLHGDERETEAVLRAEIKAMDDAGSGGFIMESRPHRDYLGEGWWRDLAICLDEAKQRGMEVWIFDEEYYPSGIAGGRVLEQMPDYRMQVLVKETMGWQDIAELSALELDFTGLFKICCVPLDGGSSPRVFYSRDAWLDWSERISHSDRNWTFHFIGIKPSWSGRMFDKMVDYLAPEVTDCFLELTYEQTRLRYKDYWGTTIKGFFGDETSFENFGSYDYLFGEETPCMPWSRVLQERFEAVKGYDLLSRVEYLWLEDGDEAATAEVRTDFMDVMTTLFSENFFGRIQRWCHAHGVQFIGHVVEDNRSHMHHGYGPGHFFRTTRHFDMGGYDFVLRQLDNEQKQRPYVERYPQFAEYRDEPYPSFFHYTLAKLAQSAAHLEIGTDLVMCENFGAYGWDLGLREMKWLTDWMTARGTNWYVPHAFSPLFPDPDCPPHFFAGGRNPQWPYFRQWGDYANRSCLMLRGVRHVSEIALLYPAEAHWAGDQDMLDDVCRTLTRNQYDFDILSMDLLLDEGRAVIGNGGLTIGQESFTTILLPNIRSIPTAVAARLEQYEQAGGRVLLVTDEAAREGAFPACSLETLVGTLAEATAAGMGITKPFGDLAFCHYRQADTHIFFLSNEGLYDVLEDTVTFPAAGVPEKWLPMTGEVQPIAAYDVTEGGVTLPLRLAPYESCFIVFHAGSEAHLTLEQLNHQQWYTAVRLQDGRLVEPTPTDSHVLAHWSVVDISTPLATDALPEPASLGAGNWLDVPALATFSGSMTYETHISLDALADGYRLELGEAGETAEAEVNGVTLGALLCPPYAWNIPAELLQAGSNTIRVKITNTLGAYFSGEKFGRDTPQPSGLTGSAALTAIAYRSIEL